MKVKMKLFLGFGVLMASFLVFGFFSIWTIGRMDQISQEIDKVWMDGVASLGAVTSHAANYRLKQYRLVAGRGADDLGKIESEMQELVNQLNKDVRAYETTIVTEKDERIFDSFKKVWGEYLVASENSFMPLVRAGKFDDAGEFLKDLRPQYEQLSKSLEDDIVLKHEGSADAMRRAESIHSQSIIITEILIFSTAAFIVVVMIFLMRSITRPLTALIGVASNVADGDLSVSIDTSGNDEFGQLSKAFKSMVDGLNNMVSQILGVAERVSASAQELSSSAQEINATTEEVSSTVQQIAKGTETQAQRVDETQKVIERMAESVTQVSKSAQNAAGEAAKSSETAQKGGELTKEARGKIVQIATEVVSSAGIVKKLGERSEQIGEIVGVITNIADQTNLLALNAAIEAARAGEYGRGFAVVAEEVRKLAESSATATEEIGKMIKDVQKETMQAVQTIECVAKEASSVDDITQKVVMSLKDIITNVESVAAMVGQVSTSSQEQAAGTKQVAESVTDIAAVAEETASATEEASASTEEMTASMEEMAASSQELADMGMQLRNAVSKFKVSSESGVGTSELRVGSSEMRGEIFSKVSKLKEQAAAVKKRMEGIRKSKEDDSKRT